MYFFIYWRLWYDREIFMFLTLNHLVEISLKTRLYHLSLTENSRRSVSRILGLKFRGKLKYNRNSPHNIHEHWEQNDTVIVNQCIQNSEQHMHALNLTSKCLVNRNRRFRDFWFHIGGEELGTFTSFKKILGDYENTFRKDKNI